MEGSTDNRSLTPPLPAKMIATNFKQNGNQVILSSFMCDKKDPVDDGRPMSTLANKFGLCNYNLTSDEEDEVTESNSKSTSNRYESTKSTVINSKCRMSEERNYKNRRNKRGSWDSSPRRTSKDRKHRRSTSTHRSENYHGRKRRSHSMEKKRFRKSKEPQKEPQMEPQKEQPINTEMRRTVAEPSIQYCENGRYTSTTTKQLNLEPKQKIRRTKDEINAINVVKTYDESEEEGKQSTNDTPGQCSSISSRDKSAKTTPIAVEHEIFAIKCERPESATDIKYQPIEAENVNYIEKDCQNQNTVVTDRSSVQQKENKSDVKSPKMIKSLSEHNHDMDVTSKMPENVKGVKSRGKVDETKVLSEDKLKQYIDEYESYIQQVSSPLNEPINSNEISENVFTTSLIGIKDLKSVGLRTEIPPTSDITSTFSPKKCYEKESLASSYSSSSDDDSSSSSSSTSSSSSSSSNDSSTSSDSSSSSDSEDKSSDDERRKAKTTSKSSSSRSASKSPRIQPPKSINFGRCQLDVAVDSDKSYNIKSPFILSKGNMNFSLNSLKTLDDLINFDDDDDLLRNIESYKNHMREKKMAKEAAEKSKLDGTLLNDSSKSVENGALLHESERKKVSLILKPMTTLKQQTQEPDKSFTGNDQPQEQQEQQPQQQPPPQQQQEQQQHHQKHETNEILTNKQTIEQMDQSEKCANEKSMDSKKKSSYRKDGRKSRRSEDRKSWGNEERSKSKRGEDRRSRRSEETSSKRNEERRSKHSEERHSRRSEERRSRRSEEKRPRRSEERRPKRRLDRSPGSPVHYRDSYYSPQYRNRSMTPPPRGPRTPPNTPPPNPIDIDEFHGDDITIRNMPYSIPVMPPPAHYQPDPNQFSALSLPSNVSNYMSEYAAYMQPNRLPAPQYTRPPPNTPPGMMPAPNSEYYYHNSPSLATPHHLPNHSIPPSSYSNLIEVPQYGAPNSSNVDCVRKQSEVRRKPTIAVQKGNVLEIVPNAEISCDRISDAVNVDKSDKVHLIDKQHQVAMQRQKHERLKRKMERHQKRLDRSKRKDFLIAELSRLSHLMIFGDDGKIIKAGEILKSIIFDGNTIKMVSSKELDDDEDLEEIYVDPPIHSYDPQATVGRSILQERNNEEKAMSTKVLNAQKRKGVLFADGVAPGDGTSASENSGNEDDGDNNIRPKKLSTRAKNKKNPKNSTATPSPPAEPTRFTFEKDNTLETKFNPKDIDQQQLVPPPPPGSPPLHLPQPKLKNPDKFIVNQLLYFHYDARVNKMIVTPTPPHMMPMMMPHPPQMIKTNPNIPVEPSYTYKSNNIRHHDTKVLKSKSSSSKSYHMLSHKSLHASNETNLIVLSSSPSNV